MLDKIFSAVENGKLNQVEECLGQDSELLNQTLDEFTMLYIAAKKGDQKICEYLLSQNADPEAGEEPALFGAIAGGHDNIVKLLLENNAEPDYRCNGLTAFLYAAKQGNLSICKILKEFGADVTEIDSALGLVSEAQIDSHQKSKLQEFLRDCLNQKENPVRTATSSMSNPTSPDPDKDIKFTMNPLHQKPNTIVVSPASKNQIANSNALTL